MSRPRGSSGGDGPDDGDGSPRGAGPGRRRSGDGIASGQDSTMAEARAGRATGGAASPGTHATTSGTARADPAGGVVSYGKNEMSHLRSHAQDIREAARGEGVDIPRGPSKPETRQAMRDYVEGIVLRPDVNGVGDYKTVKDAIWSQRGDLIVIRKPDGEFITTLRASGGRAATNAPWNSGGNLGAGE